VEPGPEGLNLISKENGELLETLPVIQALPEHRSYILSTWVRSYEAAARRLMVAGMRLSQETYRSGESKLAERFWELSRVVVSPGDTYTIHGWVAAEQGRLLHVYVPPQFRASGMARCLVERVAGTEYVVHKPWPTVPRGHQVTWSPYL